VIVANSKCCWVASDNRSELDTSGHRRRSGRYRRPSDALKPTRSRSMPVVTVHQGPRDIELKRALVARITDAFVDVYKIPADAVQVWVHEVPPDSWGTGGKLKADR